MFLCHPGCRGEAFNHYVSNANVGTGRLSLQIIFVVILSSLRPLLGRDLKYSGSNSASSPASDAVNASEPRLISQVGRVREVVYA
jgi:hypothetical protein